MSFTLANARGVSGIIPRPEWVFHSGPVAIYENPAAQDFVGTIDTTYQMVDGVYPVLPRYEAMPDSYIGGDTTIRHAVVPEPAGPGRMFITKTAGRGGYCQGG